MEPYIPQRRCAAMDDTGRHIRHIGHRLGDYYRANSMDRGWRGFALFLGKGLYVPSVAINHNAIRVNPSDPVIRPK